MKINNVPGNLTDISAKKAPLVYMSTAQVVDRIEQTYNLLVPVSANLQLLFNALDWN